MAHDGGNSLFPLKVRYILVSAQQLTCLL
jgi:hypothetical protein